MQTIPEHRYFSLPKVAYSARGEVFEFIRSHGIAEDYKARRVVYSADNLPSSVYAVERGMVKIYTLNEEGDPFTATLMFRGEPFAIVDALNHIPHATYAETLIQSRIWKLSSALLLGMAQRDHEFTMSLLHLMSGRLLQFQSLAENMCMRGAEARFAQLLVRIANEIGVYGNHGVISITPPLTHEEISHLIGATRSYTTTTIKGLIDTEIISFNRQRIVIRDIDALVALAMRPALQRSSRLKLGDRVDKPVHQSQSEPSVPSRGVEAAS